jgi:hypothetical protein
MLIPVQSANWQFFLSPCEMPIRSTGDSRSPRKFPTSKDLASNNPFDSPSKQDLRFDWSTTQYFRLVRQRDKNSICPAKQQIRFAIDNFYIRLTIEKQRGER